MRNLQLSLKRGWFEMTKEGTKTEDYREINTYWTRRLCDAHPMGVISGGDLWNVQSGQRFSFKKFSQNTLTLGYPKSTDTDRIIRFEHAGIEIREGNPEWGAEPYKLYFVIKHGKRL